MSQPFDHGSDTLTYTPRESYPGSQNHLVVFYKSQRGLSNSTCFPPCHSHQPLTVTKAFTWNISLLHLLRPLTQSAFIIFMLFFFFLGGEGEQKGSGMWQEKGEKEVRVGRRGDRGLTTVRWKHNTHLRTPVKHGPNTSLLGQSRPEAERYKHFLLRWYKTLHVNL